METAIALNERANQIVDRSVKAMAEAKAISVTDNDTYSMACDFLKGLKAIEKEINDTFDPIIKKQFEAHKEAVAQKKRHLEPIQRAEALVKPKLGAYVEEQEQIRREEERRLEAEARRREEEQRLALAAELEQNGDGDGAVALISEPIEIAPVVIPKSVPKVDGIVMRGVWKFKVVNEAIVPRLYLKVDEAKVGQVVRAMKSQTNIPGIQPYEEKGIAAGRR